MPPATGTEEKTLKIDLKMTLWWDQLQFSTVQMRSNIKTLESEYL